MSQQHLFPTDDTPLGSPSCHDCKLCQVRTKIVFPTSPASSGILAIGEAPGAEEDVTGEGFIGKAGKKLDSLMAAHGIARSQYGRANVVRCRPPGNRKPDTEEKEACLPKLAAAILKFEPRVLLLVGGTAVEAFLGKGLVFDHVMQSRRSPVCDLGKAHKALRNGLRPLLNRQEGLLCVPMPHTSGLAWNRYAKDGSRWSVLGAEQVALAVRHAHAERTGDQPASTPGISSQLVV